MIYTIGHSTRPLDIFIRLLTSHAVKVLVDVRTIPRSRHNPQFNHDAFPADLAKAGIRYLHMKGLGGLRHPRPDSINMGWHNESFRGFADHMQTPEFHENIELLIAIARDETVTIMCAEAVPWRCHRSLIADALLVRGHESEEITGPETSKKHLLTPWARVEGANITYPSAAANAHR